MTFLLLIIYSNAKEKELLPTEVEYVIEEYIHDNCQNIYISTFIGEHINQA